MALTVALAALATTTMFSPAIWRAVAYVEERHEGIGVRCTDPRKFDVELPPDYLILLRKRHAWLPGPGCLARCAWCDQSMHHKCVGDEEMVIVGDGYTCQCPHRSHARAGARGAE